MRSDADVESYDYFVENGLPLKYLDLNTYTDDE